MKPTYSVDSHHAVIEGEHTSFSGCDNRACPKRSQCLRGDSIFSVRATYKIERGNCCAFTQRSTMVRDVDGLMP